MTNEVGTFVNLANEIVLVDSSFTRLIGIDKDELESSCTQIERKRFCSDLRIIRENKAACEMLILYRVQLQGSTKFMAESRRKWLTAGVNAKWQLQRGFEECQGEVLQAVRDDDEPFSGCGSAPLLSAVNQTIGFISRLISICDIIIGKK